MRRKKKEWKDGEKTIIVSDFLSIFIFVLVAITLHKILDLRKRKKVIFLCPCVLTHWLSSTPVRELQHLSIVVLELPA